MMSLAWSIGHVWIFLSKCSSPSLCHTRKRSLISWRQNLLAFLNVTACYSADCFLYHHRKCAQPCCRVRRKVLLEDCIFVVLLQANISQPFDWIWALCCLPLLPLKCIDLACLYYVAVQKLVFRFKNVPLTLLLNIKVPPTMTHNFVPS